MLLLVGWTPRAEKTRMLWFGLLILLVFTEYPRMNLASQLSSALFFLALVRTLDFLTTDPARLSSWSSAFLSALVATAYSSLRAPFVLLALLIIIGFFRKNCLKSFFCFCILTLPWSVMLWQSSHTPYYPLFHGNVIPIEGSFRLPGERFFNFARFTLGFWFSNLVLLILYSFAALTNNRKSWSWTTTIYLSTLLVAMVLTASLSNFPRTELDRYHHGYLLGCSVLIIRMMLDSSIKRGAIDRIIAYSGLGGALIFIASATHGVTELPLRLKQAYMGLPEATQNLVLKETERKYQLLQNSIPQNATFLSATDQPYFFNSKRNTVFRFDIPGHAAPGGEIPSFSDAPKLDDYLISHGISFVVFSKPEQSNGMYSLQKWKTHAAEGRRDYHPAWARQFLNSFNYFSGLRERKKVIYQDNLNVAIDIR